MATLLTYPQAQDDYLVRARHWLTLLREGALNYEYCLKWLRHDLAIIGMTLERFGVTWDKRQLYKQRSDAAYARALAQLSYNPHFLQAA